MTIIDKACWERGCPCHDIGDEGVEIVKREWVGLTDEDFAVMVHIQLGDGSIFDSKVFAKKIEAKLKERNT